MLSEMAECSAWLFPVSGLRHLFGCVSLSFKPGHRQCLSGFRHWQTLAWLARWHYDNQSSEFAKTGQLTGREHVTLDVGEIDGEIMCAFEKCVDVHYDHFGVVITHHCKVMVMCS